MDRLVLEKEINIYRNKINLFIKKPTLGHAFLRASLDGEPKKTLFKNPWHFSKKAKYVIGFVIIAVLVVSIFAFLPKENQTPAIINVNNTGVLSPTNQPTPSATNKPNALSDLGKILNTVTTGVTDAIAPPKGPGVIESAQTIDSTVWMAVAANAWAFYQLGVGVDPETGLPYAGGIGFKGFTDWDLGSYIQSVIDAQKIGLINTNGTWGSYDRLYRVLTFLETRPLNTTTNNNWPFWFYDATNGNGYQTTTTCASNSVDIVDTGRLLVALNNLKTYNPSCTQRVNNFVYNTYGNRSNYAVLVHSLEGDSASNSIYAYYFDSGYASFWPQQLGNVPSSVLNNIFNSGKVNVSGVLLPNAPICNEPLLSSIFELNNSDSRLMGLMSQVYLAHEAYYNATGYFMATSEGGSPYNGWLYEWVVAPNGEPWVITSNDPTINCSNVAPVVYTQTAFGFLALYNTTYARNTVIYLERALLDPTNGYGVGIDVNGNIVSGVSNIGNTLILEAALYALQK